MKQLKTAVIVLGVMTLLLGLVYPLAVTGIAQLLFPFRANGSIVGKSEGRSSNDEVPTGSAGLVVGGDYRSLAVIRFAVGEGSHGLVLFWSRERAFLTDTDVGFYEGVAQTIGVALADRRAQAALRERVKELTCLYGIDQVREREDLSFAQTLQAIVELLPPAWFYPQITRARIQVDGVDYATRGLSTGLQRL